MKDNWKNKLPTHSPEKETWQRIENELSFDEWMAKQTLPTHEPKDLKWDGFGSGLKQENKAVFSITNAKKYWLVAASVLIISLLSWLVFSKNENRQVSYSTELQNTVKSNIESVDLKEIDKRCEEIKIVCNKLEIKDLRAEIEALSIESEALLEQVEVFGNDKAIINAQQKVEAQKAQMVKQLLELIDHETNS